MERKPRNCLLLLVGIGSTSFAWANAGIPMLFLAWPAQWLALVPIIGIESMVIARAVHSSTTSQLWPVARANLLSTLVGVPVAWVVMLALEAGAAGILFGLVPSSVADVPWVRYVTFPLMAAWIGGSSKLEFQAAFLVLAVPFCLVSIYVEHWSLRGSVNGEFSGALRRAVVRGNVLTYSLLSAVVVTAVAFG